MLLIDQPIYTESDVADWAEMAFHFLVKRRLT